MYDRLKKICIDKGTNISRLCTEATGNSGNLATWRKGYMRSDYLSKCADILDVSTDYILNRKTDMSEVEQRIQAETKQLSDDQKQDVLKYIEFVKTKD